MENAKIGKLQEQNPVKYNKGLNYKSSADVNEIPRPQSAFFMPHTISESSSTIVCDYLELHCESVSLVSWLADQINEDDVPECVYKYNGRVSFHYHGMGTKVYKYLVTLKVDNQDFALLQIAPRKVIGKMTAFSLQLKVINEFLYKVGTYDLLAEVLVECDIKMINFTRLDVALDNSYSVFSFLNKYVSNNTQLQGVRHVGRCRINGYEYRKGIGFSAFYIGSRKSSKLINVYNKSKDIIRTGKEYIRRFWENNIELDKAKDVYRTEVRLDSKELKKFKNLSISDLSSDRVLLEIFEKTALPMLDFRIGDDKNITRNVPIQLFDFSSTRGELLYEKTRLCQSDRYKAKLSIHVCFKLLAVGCVDYLEAQNLQEVINYYLLVYNLRDWYEQKVPIWQKKYIPIYG